MELVLDIVSIALLAGGSFFGITGAIGLLRMPDFYTRIHPAGKSDTMAQSMILVALILQVEGLETFVKLALLMALIAITSPVATHALTLAAHLDGLVPWRQKESRHE